MSQYRILATATGPPDKTATEILKPFGEIIIAPDNSEKSLLALLEGVIALVVGAEGRATERIIEAATELRVIGRTGVGYDNVNIATATARRIPVVFTPGANAHAVAEAAITLMLALCKKVTYWDLQLKSGNWRSRYESRPSDLEGATLGIIGFGHIGQALAELIRPFSMTVLAYDPYVSPARATALGVGLASLEKLLQESDFISLHVPLTNQTRGLINRQSVGLMKDGAILVNTARGAIIESLDVLSEALNSGKLSGVGLDVFSSEPPDVSHPIFKHPNCLAAPHILGATRGAMARIWKSMAEDMAAVLSGQRPRFLVNPEVLE
jgi:D-3-phosphoglycerate dehydrogenase